MPEVAEVAHACALLRRNVVGLTVRRASFPFDDLLFPVLKNAKNAGESISNTEKNICGATVKSVGRHGKYFWLRFETSAGLPLVMLMHFGMTGRIRLKGVHSHMIFMENGGDQKVLKAKSVEEQGILGDSESENLVSKAGPEFTGENGSGMSPDTEAWPPKFTKFELTLAQPNPADKPIDDSEQLELAFSDPRRLARVRFFLGEKYGTDAELMDVPPLKSLGPDYSKKAYVIKAESRDSKIIESPQFTFGDPDPCHHGRPRPPFEEFAQLVLAKKKRIKAFLLDQDFFAGIGNWVSDEILFHARIHPSEVLSKKIRSPAHPVLQKLYDSIIFVMEESVRVEGNAKLFPADWLMLHRWGKGRKQPRATILAGHKVDFDTVGGRTSCFVPDLQRPLKKEAAEEGDKTAGKSPYFDDSVEENKRLVNTPKREQKRGRKRGELEENSVKLETEVEAEVDAVDQEAKRRRSARLSAFAYVEDA